MTVEPSFFLKPDFRLQPHPAVQRGPCLIEPIFVQFEEGFAQSFERFAQLALALGFERPADFSERPLGLEWVQVKRHMFT